MRKHANHTFHPRIRLLGKGEGGTEYSPQLIHWESAHLIGILLANASQYLPDGF